MLCKALNQRLGLEQAKRRREGSFDATVDSSQQSQDSNDETEIINEFDLKTNQVDLVTADLVIREVRRFTALNGFVNVHLFND